MTSDMWDAKYADDELLWSREPNLFIPPLAETMEPGTALDLACGEGRNAIWLARNGWEVTGADFSAVAIEKARSLSADLAIEWVVADATTFSSERSFDLVMLFYLHLPADESAAAFARATEAVAPGGTLLGVGHALRNLDEGYGGPPMPDILWTADRIAPLVSGLDVIELAERERPVTGTAHVAIDLVVQAKKP